MYGVYAVGPGPTIYAATRGGLSISTDLYDNPAFTNYTQATNGLGSDVVYGVYAVGSTVYAATGGNPAGGLSISTNGGTSFTNYTDANGLGSNVVQGVYAVGSTVYAATSNGLSISGVSPGISDEPGPADLLQQVGFVEAGNCSAYRSPASTNWFGVGSGGWSQSWSRWMNIEAGETVCTRTLTYSSGRWLLK